MSKHRNISGDHENEFFISPIILNQPPLSWFKRAECRMGFVGCPVNTLTNRYILNISKMARKKIAWLNDSWKGCF